MTLPAPTIKSTKAELMEAFEELKKEYEATKSTAINPAATRRQESLLLEKTATATPAAIETELMTLRRKVQEEIDRLGRELTGESVRLGELREAIVVAGKQLKEARQIELAAEALDTLMSDHARVEKELAAKQQTAQETLTAEMAKRKKDWEREQEEYAYNLKIERKKEQDAYEAECAKKDAAREEKFAARAKELTERENAAQARQTQMAELEKTAANYPTELQNALKVAEEKLTATLKKEFDTERKLAEQEYKAEKNMLEARLSNALDMIKAQTTEITSLKKSLEAANDRAQSLAATVIESVSGAKLGKSEVAVKE